MRIADRQDLHHGDGRDAPLKIDPEKGIVDSAPCQTSAGAPSKKRRLPKVLVYAVLDVVIDDMRLVL
jgi:hypothetical protein